MSEGDDAVVSDIALPSRSQSVLFGQAFRYLIVGGVSFVVDFSVLVLLAEYAGVNYLVAAVIAFVCGLVTNYLLSVRWVFASRSVDQPLFEFVIFLVIGVLGLGWNELLLYLGTAQLGFDYRISKLFSAGLVLCWNFGVRKVLLFRDRG
jgi:putative flippase GtrA